MDDSWRTELCNFVNGWQLVKINANFLNIYDLLFLCWEIGSVPQEIQKHQTIWKKSRQGTLQPLQIYLHHSITRKAVASVTLLNFHLLEERDYPEAQCCICNGRLILEKYLLHMPDVVIFTFFSLIKTFDSGGRAGTTIFGGNSLSIETP